MLGLFSVVWLFVSVCLCLPWKYGLGEVVTALESDLPVGDPQRENPWALLHPHRDCAQEDVPCRSRYIDTESLGIALRTTQRAPSMRVVERDIPQLAERVRAVMGPQRVQSVPQTLAVMILFGFSLQTPIIEQTHRRLAYLHCSLSKIFPNLASHTPVDVYIWFTPESFPFVPAWIGEMFPSVFLMEIPPSSWQLPPDSGDPSHWNFAAMFNDDYYLMGRWRLTFAMSFLREMGYEYMLQLDDDTFIMDDVSFDIVRHFREQNVVWGLRDRVFREIPEITRGLAEFTKYWMLTRSMERPLGELFDHLQPQNMSGLSSEGWDREHYQGCFQLISVRFWHDDLVQNFLQLVLKTGSDMEQRWQEQAIQNMIRLLFVPSKNQFIFKNKLIIHGKPAMPNLEYIGCAATHSLLNSSHSPEQKYQVNLLLYLQEQKHLEVINYAWNCAIYEKDLGPCSNITQDLDYALRAHLIPYTERFFSHYDLPVEMFPIVLQQAVDKFRRQVARNAMDDPTNDEK